MCAATTKRVIELRVVLYFVLFDFFWREQLFRRTGGPTVTVLTVLLLYVVDCCSALCT